MWGCVSCSTVLTVTALIYQKQQLLRKLRDFPSEGDNVTDLFLHAGAGEDPSLFPEAGGDQLGHDSRVG